jgi:rhodanese-related sulfurtransferase
MLLRFVQLFVLVSTMLFAYSDSDIDGVDDSIDLCPNTDFDILVDENGCPQSKYFPGKIIFQIGSDTSFNEIDETISNLNIYTNYMIKEWNFSISNSNYQVTNLANDMTDNDLFLTAGYTFVKDNIRTRFSLGTKFDLSSRDSSDEERDNDYYASMNIEYFFKEKQNVFFYYSYTISGDSDKIDYSNFQSISAKQAYSLMQEDNNVTLLDVRTIEEFKSHHVRDAQLIPLGKLENNLQKLKAHKNKKILVYCQTGRRSVSASRILENNGFTPINIEGGIIAMKHVGFDMLK